MFDLDKRVFRLRELTREPLDASALRFASEQEAKADRFVAAGLVTLGPITRAEGRRSLTGSVLDDGRAMRPPSRSTRMTAWSEATAPAASTSATN